MQCSRRGFITDFIQWFIMPFHHTVWLSVSLLIIFGVCHRRASHSASKMFFHLIRANLENILVVISKDMPSAVLCNYSHHILPSYAT